MIRAALKRVTDGTRKGSFAHGLRLRRFAFFRSLLAPLPRPLRILDVGGYLDFWRIMDFPSEEGIEVTILNLDGEPFERPPFRGLRGDARSMTAFADGEMDVVFSNSVIEHVGPPADQRRMADEVRRVGRRYFVQTPNRYFPFEPHFLTPGFQFLPLRAQVFLLQRFHLGDHPRIPDADRAREDILSIRLLTAREMRALFPEARLYRERLFGFTKSLVAYGGFAPR